MCVRMRIRGWYFQCEIVRDQVSPKNIRATNTTEEMWGETVGRVDELATVGGQKESKTVTDHRSHFMID